MVVLSVASKLTENVPLDFAVSLEKGIQTTIVTLSNGVVALFMTVPMRVTAYCEPVDDAGFAHESSPVNTTAIRYVRYCLYFINCLTNNRFESSNLKSSTELSKRCSITITDSLTYSPSTAISALS